MGRSFYMKWRDCAKKLGGFEGGYNVFAFNLRIRPSR